MNRRKNPTSAKSRQQGTVPATAAATASPSLQITPTLASPAVDTLHLVCFRLDGEEMAVPVEAVVEVVRGTAVNPVSDGRRYLAGMMPYRTEIIPVVHLKQWLDIAAAETDVIPRVIVMVREGRPFGLAVDEVTQVLRGDRRRWQEPVAGDPRQRFLAGYYDEDGRRIPILEYRHLPEP